MLHAFAAVEPTYLFLILNEELVSNFDSRVPQIRLRRLSSCLLFLGYDHLEGPDDIRLVELLLGFDLLANVARGRILEEPVLVDC